MKAVILAAIATIAIGAVQVSGEERCDRWSFGMVEDEGGPAPTAYICLAANKPSLTVHCEGGASFFLSYFEGGNAPNREPGYEGRFEITIGDDTFRRTALFQAMDASLAIPEQKINGPLIAAMMNGEALSIRPMDGSHGGGDFPLAGSTAALKALAAACTK